MGTNTQTSPGSPVVGLALPKRHVLLPQAAKGRARATGAAQTRKGRHGRAVARREAFWPISDCTTSQLNDTGV
jgi:hypothetical protein